MKRKKKVKLSTLKFASFWKGIEKALLDATL